MRWWGFAVVLLSLLATLVLSDSVHPETISAGCDTGISFLYAQTTFGVMKQEQIKIVCRPSHDCASRRTGARNADPVVVGRSHH